MDLEPDPARTKSQPVTHYVVLFSFSLCQFLHRSSRSMICTILYSVLYCVVLHSTLLLPFLSIYYRLPGLSASVCVSTRSTDPSLIMMISFAGDPAVASTTPRGSSRLRNEKSCAIASFRLRNERPW